MGKIVSQVKFSEKITYSTGILGQNLIYNLMAMYILFYFTDILLIPASIASIIIIIASLWDAVNDPIMGMIADNTRSRWGKFRPYLIFGSFFIGIITVLNFSNGFTNYNSKIIFAAVTYIFWGMIFTSCDIPIWALSSVVSSSSKQRDQQVTFGKVGATIGVVISSVLSVPILNMFGGERSSTAYFYLALIFAGTGCLLMFITGLFSRERIKPNKEKTPFRENIKTIIYNKPLLLLMVALFVVNFINSIRQSVQIYFAVYTWGDANYMTLIGLSLVIGMLFGMILSPFLLSKYKKRSIYIITCIIASVVSAIPYFIDYSNVVLGLIFIGLSFLFSGIAMIVTTSMLMDTIDWAEYQNNFRSEGIVFSMNTFLTKLGATISRVILGISLVVLKYVENAPRTEKLQSGFSFMVFIIPSIAFVLAIIPIYFYNLDEEKLKSIKSKLLERRDNNG
ncbi:MAG: glycoside-pentoside-hexuronide (GPH):cation symporter [Sphaerochaetaceae bacterium]|nr:glycoside-pentoside-hexuronide (GPH):cation symporter [Sphaerochaetaceae bacterium]